VVVFSLAVGDVVDMAIGPHRRKRTAEVSLFRSLLEALLPAEAVLQIRELRYHVVQQGFRTRVVTLATTLCEVELYPTAELANLYRCRWEAELHLRSLKTHLQMEHLRCQRPETARKEFYTHLLAYNLIRACMLEAALVAEVAPHQPSFQSAVQSLNAFLAVVIADSNNAQQHSYG